MTSVALIGLGIMGAGMATNLLQKGFTLSVYNRTRAKAEPFAAAGARIGNTCREAAEGADVVIAMVGDDGASRNVWLGADGALNGAKRGAILVECSTLSPDWVRQLAVQVEEKGCKLLDAPVLGSKDAAANAQLRLFVGGDAETLERARPVLEAISSRIIHLGGTGAGATWKLINNMMIAVHVAALAEGLAMAEKAGMNFEQVIPLITNGATASLIVQSKLPRMLDHRYDDTEFSLQWMHKDASYALKLGETLNLPLKTLAGAAQVYAAALEAGLGELDFAAVAEVFRRQT